MNCSVSIDSLPQARVPNEILGLWHVTRLENLVSIIKNRCLMTPIEKAKLGVIGEGVFSFGTTGVNISADAFPGIYMGLLIKSEVGNINFKGIEDLADPNDPLEKMLIAKKSDSDIKMIFSTVLLRQNETIPDHKNT